MKFQRTLDRLTADPVRLALGVGIALGALYLVGRAVVQDVGSAVGGVVSGDNALTRGTAFEGTGIAGTIGAGANAATGGLLAKLGEKIGGFLFDLNHPVDVNLATDQRAREILAERAADAGAAVPADERSWFENLLGGFRP